MSLQHCLLICLFSYRILGQTLYDAIQASLSGELILLKEDWLKLSCNLAKSLDDMHQRGVLHNLLKSDNILIEFNQTDILDYFIGFSQATFRSGRRLKPPSGNSDSSDNSLYDDGLAPEVRHFLLSSPQSDIYSLGRIFLEIADSFCEELRPIAVAMCKDKPEERISLREVIDSIEHLNVDGE